MFTRETVFGWSLYILERGEIMVGVVIMLIASFLLLAFTGFVSLALTVKSDNPNERRGSIMIFLGAVVVIITLILCIQQFN